MVHSFSKMNDPSIFRNLKVKCRYPSPFGTTTGYNYHGVAGRAYIKGDPDGGYTVYLDRETEWYALLEDAVDYCKRRLG